MLSIVCVLLLVAGFATGCSSSQTDTAKTSVDEGIHGLEDSIGKFYLLGTSADMDEIQPVLDKIDEQWAAIEDSVAEDTDLDLDISAATEAHDALSLAVTKMSLSSEESDSPMETLTPLMDTFKAEVDKVHAAGGFHDDE